RRPLMEIDPQTVAGGVPAGAAHVGIRRADRILDGDDRGNHRFGLQVEDDGAGHIVVRHDVARDREALELDVADDGEGIGGDAERGGSRSHRAAPWVQGSPDLQSVLALAPVTRCWGQASFGASNTGRRRFYVLVITVV